jgi:hypothetical protein
MRTKALLLLTLLQAFHALAQFTLQEIGHSTNSSSVYLNDVVISGDYAYCPNGNLGGFVIYDVSSPTQPLLVGVATNGPPNTFYSYDLAVSGHHVYLASDPPSGLNIYDVSNPTNIISVSHTNDGGGVPFAVAVSGSYAYVANAYDGLRVYDVSNPAYPVNVGHISGGYASDVAAAGNYVLGNWSDGLRIYDVSSPANPILVAQTNNGGFSGKAIVSGNYAYMANSDDGIRIYDISSPTNLIFAGHGTTSYGGQALRVAVSGTLAYLANGSDGLRVYGVSNPANPVNVGHTDVGIRVNGVAVSGCDVYLACGGQGLRTFKLVGPQLEIGFTGTNAVSLSWATNSLPFTLQQNTNYTKANWSAATNAPVVISNQYQVILPVPTDSQIFRLKYP